MCSLIKILLGLLTMIHLPSWFVTFYFFSAILIESLFLQKKKSWFKPYIFSHFVCVLYFMSKSICLEPSMIVLLGVMFGQTSLFHSSFFDSITSVSMKLMQQWYCLSILFWFLEKLINGIDDTNSIRLVFLYFCGIDDTMVYYSCCQNGIVMPVNLTSCVCDFIVCRRTVSGISDTVHTCHLSFELSPSAESPTLLGA